MTQQATDKRYVFPEPRQFFADHPLPERAPSRPLKEAPIVEVSCVICGGTSERDTLESTLPSVDTPSRIDRCRACDLVYLTPRTAEHNDAWSHELSYIEQCVYPDFKSRGIIKEDGLLDTKRVDVFHAPHLDAISGVAPDNRTPKLMDIGTGLGLLPFAAKRAGWDAFGIEPSMALTRLAGPVLGIDFAPAMAEFAKPGSGTLNAEGMDCVTMIDSLEHTFNPVEAVGNARSALRKGGVLFISVPNYEADSRKSAGLSWKQYVSDHYHYFTIASLERLLFKAGFSAVALRVDTPLQTGTMIGDPGMIERLRATDPGGPAMVLNNGDQSADSLYAWAIR